MRAFCTALKFLLLDYMFAFFLSFFFCLACDPCFDLPECTCHLLPPRPRPFPTQLTPQWREASATPSMASITSTDESFQYHGDHLHQQRDHYQPDHQQQHQYPDHNSPANSSKMSANLLDSCL